MPGTLYVVATPIGNLEDLSFRALRTLKEVDVIAAEDTRRTSKLLAHYAIRKSMVSLREHNEHRETPRLIARIAAGESVALVSDAGTPGIADPGQHLVRAAREAGITVSPIPGPSAIVAALSSSGVPSDRFTFFGFPPRSGSARRKWLEEVKQTTIAVVFFEAPHRILRTLEELSLLLANRPIYVHRELSKINEQLVIWPQIGIASNMPAIGEFVCVLPPIDSEGNEDLDPSSTLSQAVEMFECLTNNCSFQDEIAERLVSAAVSVEPRVVRKAVKQARIARKRREDALS